MSLTRIRNLGEVARILSVRPSARAYATDRSPAGGEIWTYWDGGSREYVLAIYGRRAVHVSGTGAPQFGGRAAEVPADADLYVEVREGGTRPCLRVSAGRRTLADYGVTL